MNIGIPEDKHGILDYTYVPMVLAAPALAGFEQDKISAGFCRIVGISVLGYTLLTDAKWGAVKVIPYKTHAVLDVAVGLVTLASLAARKISNKNARTSLLLMGITGIVVGYLSIIGAKKK